MRMRGRVQWVNLVHTTIHGLNRTNKPTNYALETRYIGRPQTDTSLQIHTHDRQLLRMRSTKVVATCIFNKLQAAGGVSSFGRHQHAYRSLFQWKCRTLANNAILIRNESLFVVSAAAMSSFQLKHTSRLLRTEHMSCRLSETDHQNISHVAVRQILLVRI